MKKHFLLILWVVSFSLPAQQPQWELFFPDISGPIAVDPTNSDIIYIASGKSYESGMWKTTDGGKTWNLYSDGWGMGRPADILINPDNPQEILVGGAPFVGVHKSTDGGKTWIRADYGIKFDHHGFLVWQLAYDRQRRIYYLADQGWAFGGIYRSVDGINWQWASSLRFSPLSIIVDESIGHLYAGTSNGIWMSVDSGNTWIEKNNGLPTKDITPPILYPDVWHLTKVRTSQTIYCALIDYGIDKTLAGGIYKTQDGANNWFSVNDSIIDTLDFRGGLVVSGSDTNTVFAGSRFNPVSDSILVQGIYLTRDGGRSWDQCNYGLPDTILDFATRHLFLDHQSNSLYADIALFFSDGGAEEGIYRLTNAIITSVLKPPPGVVATKLELNAYPNPFNTQTTFVIKVLRKCHLTVRIFNILGKEVMRLLDKELSPGEYQVTWDGKNGESQVMPSGVYFASMQSAGESLTIKILILK